MKIGFITVYTNKLKESVDFYTNIFGFKILRNFSPKPGMEITFLTDEDGALLEFIQEENTPKYVGKGISIGFEISDIYKTLEMLKENNVQIIHEPIEMPNGTKIFHAIDLNGLELSFVQASGDAI